MPFVDVHHAVAPVNLDDWSDERDQVVANLFDVWTFVNGQPVSQLHQRRRRTGFGRMDSAGDVIDRNRIGDDLFGFVVIQVDYARVGELRQPVAVLRYLRNVGFGADRHGDHLAPLFGLADRIDFDARAG